MSLIHVQISTENAFGLRGIYTVMNYFPREISEANAYSLLQSAFKKLN